MASVRLTNRRLAGMGTTIFAEMSALAISTGAINLGQGFPDVDGPESVSEAAVESIRSGLGIAVLPAIVADAEPDLIQCVPPKAGHGRSMWLVTHERVRHSPRVRAAIDFLYEKLTAHIRMLDDKRAAHARPPGRAS